MNRRVATGPVRSSPRPDLVTRDELGLTSSSISKRVARGTLTRRYPGVYSYGRGELSAEAGWMAAILACGPGAALAHLSVAELFEASRWPADPPHVIVPRRHRTVEGIVIHHCLGLEQADVSEHRGIPITTIPRMLLDLSATHTPHQVAFVINRLAYRRRFDLRATLRTRMRAMGHPGTGVLARAIELHLTGSAGTRSGLEDAFLALMAGHPEPLVNTERLGYELDFRWEKRNLVVEIDGNHTLPGDRRKDPARDAVLRAAGYSVVRFTAPELPAAPARLAPYFR